MTTDRGVHFFSFKLIAMNIPKPAKERTIEQSKPKFIEILRFVTSNR